MTNTTQQLPAPTKQEFLNWIQALGRFGSQPEFTSNNDGMDMSITITTHSARYGITAIMPATERPESPGYLGCIASTPGGGNDLADGPFNLHTWAKILADMLAYEAASYKPPQPAEPQAP